MARKKKKGKEGDWVKVVILLTSLAELAESIFDLAKKIAGR